MLRGRRRYFVEALEPRRLLNAAPALDWSSYLGGSNSDGGYSIAIDVAGNAWVTGYTGSSGWAVGGFDTSYNGGFRDAFVAKINANGTLAWSSYLGGSNHDSGYSIAIDGGGNAWVTGHTESSGWAVGGFDTSYNGGTSDAFVAKINANGTLAWSSYLGGSDYDAGNSIAIDGAGNAWVMGSTASSGWAVGGFDTSYNGVGDAFVAKINANGTLAWSSYLGGSANEGGNSIAIDGAGNAWVTSYTSSVGWAVGGFDTSYNGGLNDAFVAKINANGTLAWSSYLGGSSWDEGYSIAIDGGGNAWVTGETLSSGWAVGGFDTSHNGNSDAFVAKVNANGTLAWSSYLGGSNPDWGYSVAIDGGGNAWVTGYTGSSGWAVGGFDTSHNGASDAFVAKINANGTLAWSSYLGGSSTDYGYGIAIDGAGNAWVTGRTSSSGWAVGGFDTSHNGFEDAFLAKITDAVVAPAVTASQFHFATLPQRLTFSFDTNVAASLALDDIDIRQLPGGAVVTPDSLSYDTDTNTATVTFAAVLADANYRATLLAAGITNPSGTPMGTDHVFDFFFLNGDANRDARVNLADFNILAANFGQEPRDFTQGDFSYDGRVNLADFNILASRFGTSLGPDGAIGREPGLRLPPLAAGRFGERVIAPLGTEGRGAAFAAVEDEGERLTSL